GASVTNLTWTGPGTADAGKSNNGNDQCNSNVGGAVCFDLAGLSTTIGSNTYPGAPIPASWDVKGSYTGNLGTSCSVGTGSCLVVLADAEFTSGSSTGKTAFAVSQDVSGGGTQQMPEPSSVGFLAAGVAILGWRRAMAGLRKR
ncbi:MAG TPA: hypothetical protein VE998_06155, partial [Terriglobales bacterium]|nr:hypothetical protein [Terriglobales bacterium]